MFNDLLMGDSIDTTYCKVQGGAHQSLSPINDCLFNFNASFHFRISALKTIANVTKNDCDDDGRGGVKFN